MKHAGATGHVCRRQYAAWNDVLVGLLRVDEGKWRRHGLPSQQRNVCGSIFVVRSLAMFPRRVKLTLSPSVGRTWWYPDSLEVWPTLLSTMLQTVCLIACVTTGTLVI